MTETTDTPKGIRAIYEAAKTLDADLAAVSWNGFNLAGDAASIKELRRLMHSEQWVDGARKEIAQLRTQISGAKAHPSTTEETIRDVVKPHPLRYSLDDYWKAPGGEGPLGAEWKNKPHRLLYDLLAALLHAEDVANG
ncbi:MAG: hypothetical protein JWQ02_4240 [Capsulimonas sp.]|nr:hypothetical protein [Capsulimonas sp.]